MDTRTHGKRMMLLGLIMIAAVVGRACYDWSIAQPEKTMTYEGYLMYPDRLVTHMKACTLHRMRAVSAGLHCHVIERFATAYANLDAHLEEALECAFFDMRCYREFDELIQYAALKRWGETHKKQPKLQCKDGWVSVSFNDGVNACLPGIAERDAQAANLNGTNI